MYDYRNRKVKNDNKINIQTLFFQQCIWAKQKLSHFWKGGGKKRITKLKYGYHY